MCYNRSMNTTTTANRPTTWLEREPELSDGGFHFTDPAHLALPDFDPALPVFEVWINGRRFACTQRHGVAFKLLRTMEAGRPAHTSPELRVVNDRRTAPRS